MADPSQGDQAERLHEVPPRRPAGRLLEQLAERLGASARIDVVVGTPVEHDGVKVIPIAKVRYGFGGGEGEREREGSGGGGGVAVAPIGYVELRAGRAKFHRTLDASGVAAMLSAAALLVLVTSRAIVRIRRR
jgi:uncharacterized spore protein YtfJ